VPKLKSEAVEIDHNLGIEDFVGCKMVGSTHSTTVRLRQAAKKGDIALYRA
jgi:hypothetical protein